MKAKLIKTEVNYILEDDKGVVIASTSLNKEGLSLSIKNCQVIENGYDLDELVKSKYPNVYNEDYEYDSESEMLRDEYKSRGFNEGFQKALDLNNTKLYTLEDMMNCWNKALTFQDHKELFGYHIQSLKQKEWDVEVVMVPAMSNNGNVYYGDIPKLDENRCLILKRID